MKYLAYLFALITYVPAWSQERIINKAELFAQGITIENLNVFIPWGTSFYDISKYGNPLIIQRSTKWNEARWDSVRIINNIQVSLVYTNYKCFLCNKEDEKLRTITAFVDSLNFERLRIKLEAIIQVPGKIYKQKRAIILVGLLIAVILS
ncbi:hypothetical protein [Paraflavitalea speifideaquila]|uniref:hypothetical protein n=1 Tax=Paraflavitalea speifideaquila TaxID=3076558 RepID=UPI0028E838F9|nr:hypothetical protein [Paraflavitalea speifideiaquila]